MSECIAFETTVHPPSAVDLEVLWPGDFMSATIHIFLSDDIVRMCQKFDINAQEYLVNKLQEKIHTEATVWAAARFHSKEQSTIYNAD